MWQRMAIQDRREGCGMQEAVEEGEQLWLHSQ